MQYLLSSLNAPNTPSFVLTFSGPSSGSSSEIQPELVQITKSMFSFDCFNLPDIVRVVAGKFKGLWINH